MHVSTPALALFLSLLVGCGGETAPSSPAEVAEDETTPVPSTPPPEEPSPPAVDPLLAVRVVSTDGDWNVLSVLDGAYHVTFPGAFEWEVAPASSYTAYRAAELYEGRIYTLWIHRYPAGSPALDDPLLVDDSCAAFGLTSGAVVAPRLDFIVGSENDIQGRAGRYTNETERGTSFNDLVVFRVNDDLVFHSITSRPDYAPIAHFRRMNEGFSVQEVGPR